MKRKSIALLVLITIFAISLFAFPASVSARPNGIINLNRVFYSIVSSPFNESIEIQTSYGTYDEALSAAKDMARDIMNRSDVQEEIATLDNGEFVNYIYDALFHRTPDEEGYESWVNGLSSGLSRSEVIESLINSEEFGLRYIYKTVLTLHIT